MIKIQYEGKVYDVEMKPPTRKAIRTLRTLEYSTAPDDAEDALSVLVHSVNGEHYNKLPVTVQWVLWYQLNDFLGKVPGIHLHSEARVEEGSSNSES